jgi:hypothetical protein
MNIPSAAEVKAKREARQYFTTDRKDMRKVLARRLAGPYHLTRGYHTQTIYVKTQGEQGLFDLGIQDNWDEVDEGTASFIVNAMNSFDSLVALAEKTKAQKLKQLKRYTPVSKNAKELRKEIKEIDKVLKQAFSRVKIVN